MRKYMNDPIFQLTVKLMPLKKKIIEHPLYANINSLPNLRIFMEQHVFAVWDFMCLLKELHRNIVSTSAPWFPPKDALSANLINSILIEEEGDIAEDGVTYSSHYDTYLKAMERIGAKTKVIKHMLKSLQDGHDLINVIKSLPIQEGTKNFMLTTFSFFNLGVHEIAAAFVFGREGITAGMFLPLVMQLESDNEHQEQLSTLIYYLKRHIELDDEEHFPKAIKMLSNLINGDEKKLQESENAAMKAMLARIDFLTKINQSLLDNNGSALVAETAAY